MIELWDHHCYSEVMLAFAATSLAAICDYHAAVPQLSPQGVLVYLVESAAYCVQSTPPGVMLLWLQSLMCCAEWATVLFVIQLSLGESIWSPRWYDYSMSVAPEGREGVFTAMASAPLFLGKFVTGVYPDHLSCCFAINQQ